MAASTSPEQMREPARRVFLSQVSPDRPGLLWMQGVVISLGDKVCQIDDGTAIATLHCHHIVDNGSLAWDAIRLFSYLLVVATPFEAGQLVAVRVVDLSENPNRETIWMLETMAHQKNIR